MKKQAAKVNDFGKRPDTTPAFKLESIYVQATIDPLIPQALNDDYSKRSFEPGASSGYDR